MDALQDLKWLLLILLGLWVAWFLTGGPGRLTAKKPFVEPLGIGTPEQTYGPGDTTTK